MEGLEELKERISKLEKQAEELSEALERTKELVKILRQDTPRFIGKRKHNFNYLEQKKKFKK